MAVSSCGRRSGSTPWRDGAYRIRAAVSASNIQGLDLLPDQFRENRKPLADIVEREGVAYPDRDIPSDGVIAVEQRQPLVGCEPSWGDGQRRLEGEWPLLDQLIVGSAAFLAGETEALEQRDRRLSELIVAFACRIFLEGAHHIAGEQLPPIGSAFILIDRGACERAGGGIDCHLEAIGALVGGLQ